MIIGGFKKVGGFFCVFYPTPKEQHTLLSQPFRRAPPVHWHAVPTMTRSFPFFGDRTMSSPTADIGLIGLAVMGENLVLNMESHGFTVAVYNRTTSKVDDFVNGRGKGKKIVGTHSIKELVGALKRPRKVMIMVKAGSAVDDTIAQVAPLLESGDILIDGGNTHY